MRPYILRALLRKEVDRHLANRGGLALGGLLVVAALLLSAFNPGGTATPAGGPLPGLADDPAATGVYNCYVDLLQETRTTRAVFNHLKDHRPPELVPRLKMRVKTADDPDELITYQTGTGAIQLRSHTDADGRETVLFEVWHPPDAPGGMAPFERWFWAESLKALAGRAEARGASLGGFAVPDFADDLWPVRDAYRRLREAASTSDGRAVLPVIEVRRQGLGGKPFQFRDAIATAMVVFALYFSCVYLLPTLTCEERERGVLLAQALSPASPAEILAAKFLFYPALGLTLAAVVAGLYRPGVLGSPFFWLSLLAVAGAFLGIGMTVASLATTQRAAFLGSMCYLLSVSLLLTICQQNGITSLPNLAIEYHGPRLLHAAMTNDVLPMHWGNLAGAVVLAGAWVGTAGWLFRRRGWQ